MSNFFSRLVARSLNPVAAIQPRIASRFEPDSHSLATGELEPAEAEIASGPVPDASQLSRPFPIQILENKSLTKVSGEAARMSDRPAVENVVDAPESVPPDSTDVQAPELFKQAAADAAAEGPASFRPFPEMRRRKSPTHAARAHDHFPPTDRDDLAPPAKLPPPIHVTIGRVEVRAILPAAPPVRKNSPPASKVSLQDHLRNGGRA